MDYVNDSQLAALMLAINDFDHNEKAKPLPSVQYEIQKYKTVIQKYKKGFYYQTFLDKISPQNLVPKPTTPHRIRFRDKPCIIWVTRYIVPKTNLKSMKCLPSDIDRSCNRIYHGSPL